MADERIEESKARHDAAMHEVFDVFDKYGLSLWTRWHVCHCIAIAAMEIMAPSMKKAAQRIAAVDWERVRAELGIDALSEDAGEGA